MKSIIRLAFLVAVIVTASSCRDKAAEKKIAELEARLSQLEKDKPASAATPTAAPAATPTPDTKPEGPIPAFKFERMEHDFGQIHEGDKVAYTYKFQNTGQAPLIIQGVQPTCGCTAPDWSKEPIPAGGSGFVKVEFDSNGKQGIQNKTVTVSANTWPKTLVLRFKAQVNPKPEGGAPLR